MGQIENSPSGGGSLAPSGQKVMMECRGCLAKESQGASPLLKELQHIGSVMEGNAAITSDIGSLAHNGQKSTMDCMESLIGVSGSNTSGEGTAST